MEAGKAMAQEAAERAQSRVHKKIRRAQLKGKILKMEDLTRLLDVTVQLCGTDQNADLWNRHRRIVARHLLNKMTQKELISVRRQGLPIMDEGQDGARRRSG